MSGQHHRSMNVVFQHLDTVSKGKDVFLIGRTMCGESVAVKITDIRPHFCIQMPARMDKTMISSFVSRLKEKVFEFSLHSRMLYKYTDKVAKTVPNVFTDSPDDIPNDYITYDIVDGQNIVSYSETGPKCFIRLYAMDRYVLRNMKEFMTAKTVPMVKEVYYLKQKPDAPEYTERNAAPKTKCLKKQSTLGTLKVEMKLKPTDAVYTLFNDHVDYTLQYLIDEDIYSCGFIEVNGIEKPRETSCDIELLVTSIKQVKVDGMAPWRILSYDIESVPRPVEGRKDKYMFPTAWKDPICTIGVTLQTGSDISLYAWILNAPVNPFTNPDRNPTKKLDPLETPPDEYRPEETKVYFFDDELDMIKHFLKFIVTEDVDFIEGHNINRFDNTYLLDRYSCLMNKGVKPRPWEVKLPIMGRMLFLKSKVTVKTFSSNQKGSHEKYKLYLPGRIILDSYDIMKDQHNESSYKLDSLAEKYLGTKKIDQDYNEIYPMWHTQKGRHDLAVYCVKDSWLVRKMMDKLCKLTVFLQMSNVTGISMKDVIERGQGIRTIGLMLRYAKDRKPHEYFIPRIVKEQKMVTKQKFNFHTNQMEVIEVEAEPASFEGAIVVPPTTGFYKDAVSCLDFASLYPSIMRALNMSYETLVSPETVDSMGWKELEGKEEAVGVRTIPDFSYNNMQLTTVKNRKNPIFVSASTRKGLLPEMLEAVLHERKMVKKQMKKILDKTSTEYKVKDGRQLGLKVVANSMYGFTGATTGFLPEKRIAASVTKYGRYMITQTKAKVENHPVWGKKHGCRCIYGDTDSVFVHMPRSLVDGDTEEELMKNAHKMGEEMADYITDIFLPPNELEYEKSYSSFLLLRKKRYAGFKFEPGHKPKLQIKGLEAARRDYAPLLVETQKKMLNILLLERDIQKACDYVSQVVFDLMNHNIPIEKLIMSKKLSRPPEKYKAMAAHVNLALRLAKEAPDTAPIAGDRVDYVIFNSTSTKVSQSACLPSEIKSGRYSIDVDYYMEKQLKNPLLRILEKVVDNPTDLFRCNSIFKPNQSSGMMASFLGKRSMEKSTNVLKLKRVKAKSTKESKMKTIAMLFGRRKTT